jgi:hypothetical protein
VQADNQIYLEVPAKSFAVFVEGDIRDEVIDISTPVAVQDIPIKQFSVYPNPANDVIYFALNFVEETIAIEITDAQGRIVIKDTKNNADKTINIKELPAGIYFLKLNATEAVWVSAFMKE